MTSDKHGADCRPTARLAASATAGHGRFSGPAGARRVPFGCSRNPASGARPVGRSPSRSAVSCAAFSRPADRRPAVRRAPAWTTPPPPPPPIADRPCRHRLAKGDLGPDASRTARGDAQGPWGLRYEGRLDTAGLRPPRPPPVEPGSLRHPPGFSQYRRGDRQRRIVGPYRAARSTGLPSLRDGALAGVERPAEDRSEGGRAVYDPYPR